MIIVMLLFTKIFVFITFSVQLLNRKAVVLKKKRAFSKSSVFVTDLCGW